MIKIKKQKYSISNKLVYNNGYAILFTVILISIISLISIGLSSTTYKQLMLSSGATDSQTSFYMSDMATECVLYADIKMVVDSSFNFPCGITKNGTDSFLLTSDIIPTSDGLEYSLDPESSIQNSIDPCFRIKVYKTNTPEGVKTEIESSGYNICNKSNKRTVERTIKTNY